MSRLQPTPLLATVFRRWIADADTHDEPASAGLLDPTSVILRLPDGPRSSSLPKEAQATPRPGARLEPHQDARQKISAESAEAPHREARLEAGWEEMGRALVHRLKTVANRGVG